MAKINGIEIRNTERYTGHDGETDTKGTVWYNGKLLGNFEQDRWSSDFHYSFDTDILDEAVAKYASSDRVPEFYKGLVPVRLGMVIADLVIMNRIENMYRDGIGNGYRVLVAATDRCKCMGLLLEDEALLTMTDEEVIDVAQKAKSFRNQCMVDLADDWDGKFIICRSIDDFDITAE